MTLSLRLPSAPKKKTYSRSLEPGGALTNLTNSIGSDERPIAWLPNGRIAFITLRGGLEPYLATMNPDGSNVSKVQLPVNVDPGSLAWSPSGRTIAFSGPGSGIYVAKSDGSNPRAITQLEQTEEPAWSPDGTKIAFARFGSVDFRGIWLMRSNGINAHRVALGTDPAWSPDGTRLVYTHDVSRYNGRGNRVGAERLYVKDLRTLKPGVPLR